MRKTLSRWVARRVSECDGRGHSEEAEEAMCARLPKGSSPRAPASKSMPVHELPHIKGHAGGKSVMCVTDLGLIS
ncbi:unnamed protein product [Citrullus colocynthis]|uniref:Uncharacterized protein n=1 Tax=Citrullus colocynthis TaxID=252529 RepID=A0ABP0XYL4_9ROSI